MLTDLQIIFILILIGYLLGLLIPRHKKRPSIKSIKEDSFWFFVNEIAMTFLINLLGINLGDSF